MYTMKHIPTLRCKIGMYDEVIPENLKWVYLPSQVRLRFHTCIPGPCLGRNELIRFDDLLKAFAVAGDLNRELMNSMTFQI